MTPVRNQKKMAVSKMAQEDEQPSAKLLVPNRDAPDPLSAGSKMRSDLRSQKDISLKEAG